jgi:hypothetical protein
MKLASLSLLVVAIVSVAALILLANTGKVTGFETETYKAALELLLITVTGQVISLLVTRATQAKEETKARDAFRREIITRLNRTYIDIKKLRRLMRAKSIRNRTEAEPFEILESLYQEFLSQLNDSQLSLEVIAKDIQSAQGLFTDYNELHTDIHSMEEYLNHIVDEFEEALPSTDGISPRIRYLNYPRIADLIGAYKSSAFRRQFVHPYYRALDLLRKDLLYMTRHSKRTNIEETR